MSLRAASHFGQRTRAGRPLAVTTASARRQRVRPTPPAAQEIANEFEKCAVLVSLAACLLNRPNPKTVVNFSRSAFRPFTPGIFEALRPELPELGFTRAEIELFDIFYSHYMVAHPAIVEIASDMPNGFDRDFGLFALGSLTLAATAGWDLLAQLEASSNEPLSNASAFSSELKTLLDDVRRGRTPLWNGDRLEVPEWHNRRLLRRYPLNFPAHLECQAERLRVMVTDISRGGLKIVPSPLAPVGDTVELRFDFGRTLIGRIVWRTGEAAGVELSTPLPLHDPLLGS